MPIFVLPDQPAMNRIARSIPVKIGLVLLIVEMVMFTVLGIFYGSRFSREIDSRITEKMALPGILMNQRALSDDAVKDFRVLGELVREKVVEAFIFGRDGRVVFAADPDREGRPYVEFLEPPEQAAYGEDVQSARQVAFTGPGDSHFRSSITPLLARGEVLGGVYIRISADGIQEEKAKAVRLFCFGALLTIVLTTLVEMAVVHRMFIPRIDHAATVLQQCAGGDFSSRITRTGAPDQLGRLMQRVNFLLETIEKYTGKKETQLATETRLLMVEDLEKKNRMLQDTLDELKNTQLQLVQSEKMAAVGMTAGGVAHDLNNILAGVVSYPELLLATLPADNEVRRPLELILASGRRAVAVVADLLTLAKGSAGAKQHVRLDGLVEEYLHSVEFRQMMRDYPEVRVVTEYEAEQYAINCSPAHIRKAIMNLVMNAVEAVMPSGGTVTLRTRQAGEGNGGDGSREEGVVLEVHDDGPGIPPESREHIFEPFYTRKTMGKKGTGLGLTVVWNVVREHDGRIELDCGSSGTTFRIFLPATASPGESGSTAVEAVNLQGQGLILVVDDEPMQRDVAEKMLTAFGYEVAAVPSGEEAVVFVRGRKVDLVILDMLMPPGMNGLETYRKIIERYPGQKALIVSGFSESGDVKKAMELGVGGFVKKPYTMAQIAAAVKNELKRSAGGPGG